MGLQGDVGAVREVGIPGALALAAAAYLLGSVPFALLLGRLRGVDIRRVGSGNIGATNLSRALGRRWGIAGFALDFLKGLTPALAAAWLPAPAAGGEAVLAPHAQMACAAAAVLGHIFPVWLRFRGGKGVATAFGAVTALSWIGALAAGAAWLAIYIVTRTVSIASLGAALVFPVATVVLFRKEPAAVALPMDLLAAGLGVLIVIRHRSNIRRLLAGEERRF